MSPFRLSWRLSWRGAVIWSAVLAITLFAGAEAYRSAYRDETARRLLVATLGHSRALEVLYGPPLRLDTVGGFAAWRYGTAVYVVAGLWTLLTVTRLLRGEEEQGRAEPLLTGRVRSYQLLAAQLAAIGVGVAVLAFGTAIGCLAAGLPLAGSALYGAGCAGVAAVFAGLSAVASQLWDSRRRAAGVVGAVLGAAFILRAFGDGASHAHWLVWVSPIGWGQRLYPFVYDRTAPLLLLYGVAALLVGWSFWLRSLRDAGAGVITSSTRERRMRPVRTAAALDWRLARGGLVAWLVGVAAYAVLLGYMAGDIADFARKDRSVNAMFARLGGSSVVTVNGFLGLTFSLLAVVLAVYAGSQVSSGRTLESEGRVEPLVAGGVSRVRWLATRAGLGALFTIVLAVCAGVFAWVGTQWSGVGAHLTSAVGGALNTVPVALLFGGLTVAAFGVVPRLTAAVAFGAVAVTYLVQFIGAIAKAPSWVLDLSPFNHVAAVPFHPVNLTATLVMLAGALALFGFGTLAFRRRDLAEL